MKSRQGEIITFYSYKGGTGRSLAVANIAWILASNNLRVLTIDWDLEAPGLHRYFKPFLIDPELASTPGLIDYLWELSKATLSTSSSDDFSDSRRPNLSENAVRLDWEFDGDGYVDLLPAGQQDESYARRVTSFDWENFYTRLGGGHLLDHARDRLYEDYDYVLIDSRTGVSDTSGICTVQMPDSLVACFTLNNQSITGVSAILKSVISQRAGRSLRIMPLATRIELAEKNKLDAARRRAQTMFSGYVDDRKYWESMEVLYFPYYAYEEILACFGDTTDGSRSSNTLLASMERVTQKVTGRPDLAVPDIPETIRLKVLEQYAYEPSVEASGRRELSMQTERRKEQLVEEADAWFASDMHPDFLLSDRSLKNLKRYSLEEEELSDLDGVHKFLDASRRMNRFTRLTTMGSLVTFIPLLGLLLLYAARYGADYFYYLPGISDLIGPRPEAVNPWLAYLGGGIATLVIYLLIKYLIAAYVSVIPSLRSLPLADRLSAIRPTWMRLFEVRSVGPARSRQKR